MNQTDQDRLDGWQAARRGDDCPANASAAWREGFALWQPKRADDALASALAAIDALAASPRGQACKAAFARQAEQMRRPVPTGGIPNDALRQEHGTYWGRP